MNSFNPLTPAMRDLIATIHHANPSLSCGAIARKVGVSPETVRIERIKLGWRATRKPRPGDDERVIHLRRVATLRNENPFIGAKRIAAMLGRSQKYAATLLAEAEGLTAAPVIVAPVVNAPKPPHLALPSGRFSDWY